MTKLTEKTWIPLGQTLAVVAVILGCTYTLGAHFASLDAKVGAIPALEVKVDALSAAAAKQDTAIQLMQKDVSGIVKRLNQMKQAPAIAGPLNRWSFGSVN